MEDNQEISAFMFRRTVPAVHLTSEDVRWMVSLLQIFLYCARTFSNFSLLDFLSYLNIGQLLFDGNADRLIHTLLIH